jgi:hypothetical protein
VTCLCKAAASIKRRPRHRRFLSWRKLVSLRGFVVFLRGFAVFLHGFAVAASIKTRFGNGFGGFHRTLMSAATFRLLPLFLERHGSETLSGTASRASIGHGNYAAVNRAARMEGHIKTGGIASAWDSRLPRPRSLGILENFGLKITLAGLNPIMDSARLRQWMPAGCGCPP